MDIEATAKNRAGYRLVMSNNAAFDCSNSCAVVVNATTKYRGREISARYCVQSDRAVTDIKGRLIVKAAAISRSGRPVSIRIEEQLA